MSRVRFETLNEHLALTDPNSENNPDTWPRVTSEEKKAYYKATRANPLYALKEVYNLVLSNCKSKYRLKRNLAVDEAMIGYKGTKAALRRVFMPLKPTRVGFKIFALCESQSGYMANFRYQKAGHESMTDVVLKLIDPFEGKFHHVFTDKLYTSVDLAHKLRAKKVYLTGAIKTTAKFLPKDLIKDKENPDNKRLKDLNKCPRGTWYVRSKGSMTYCIWKDSKVLSVLSTAHNAYRNRDTDIVTRRFSKDGIESSRKHDIPCPPQAIAYQENYGGVDKADQLRSYFTMARKSQVWYMQVLFFLVDVSQVNAFICYSQQTEGNANHPRFVMDIAEQLIQGYTEPNRRVRQDTRASVIPPRAVRHVLINTKKAKACVGCKEQGLKSKNNTGKRERRTVYACGACNRSYCHACFLWYHPTAVDEDSETLPDPKLDSGDQEQDAAEIAEAPREEIDDSADADTEQEQA